VRVVRGDQINMMFLEGETATIVRGRGEGINDAPVCVSSDPLLREVFALRRPLWVSHLQEDDRVPPFRSTVCAPIQIGGSIVGFLNVHGRRPGQFDRTDAERLDAFTHHAAAAIANARLYEQAQREIAERKRTEERIVASLKEKEVLLKEIHHRVKNNLQVVSSLLSLQSRSISDERILALFQSSRMRVNAMALVHETLYRSHDLARVDLAEYIRGLADHIVAMSELLSGGAALELDVDPVQVSVDTAMPCGLLLNELILNSLKHAFRDRGEGRIRITVRSEPPGDIVMVVSDNGRGFPEGLDFRKTSSLGLQLVNTLVAQLGGTIELAPAPGTRYTVRFPNPSTADP
jgi:two-component sensor histidine kinase